MMLTIHTFMAIITADNYMDETFFQCNRISSASSYRASRSFFVLKHTFWTAREEEKTRWKEISNDGTGDRAQNLFMISRSVSRNGTLYMKSYCNDSSALEPRAGKHYWILIIVLRGAPRRKTYRETAQHCCHRKKITFKLPRGSMRKISAVSANGSRNHKSNF